MKNLGSTLGPAASNSGAVDGSTGTWKSLEEKVADDVDPPEYSVARLPTVPNTFTFSPLSFNSMLLLPPETAADGRPPYYISVGLNCFMPTSFITTIRRGSENGEYVGEFEMGLTRDPASLIIRNQEYLMSETLVKIAGGSIGRGATTWHWQLKGYFHTWECFGDIKTCSSMDKNVTYAKFSPSKKTRTRMQVKVETRRSTLEVFPEGQPFFEDILIAALILERKRLSPAVFD